MSRRRIVGFEQIESPEMRMFMAAVTSDFNRPRTIGLGRYWCAADKPDADVEVKPIYRTTRVPADAECADCYISLRDLQRVLTDLGAEGAGIEPAGPHGPRP